MYEFKEGKNWQWNIDPPISLKDESRPPMSRGKRMSNQTEELQ